MHNPTILKNQKIIKKCKFHLIPRKNPAMIEKSGTENHLENPPVIPGRGKQAMAEQAHLDFDCGVRRIVTVVKREPDANWSLVSSQHPSHCVLCIALSGESIYHFDNGDEKPARIREGDTLFFMGGPQRRAYSVPEAPWRYISVTFDLIAYNDQSKKQLEALPFLSRSVPPAVVSAFQELNDIWTGKGPAYMLKCRALLESILYELVRLHTAVSADSSHFEKIEKVRQYIQENYSQPCPVEELAAMARCSPSHFRMLFKRVVGMTANQYVTMVRIGKAKDFLLSGEMNVSETAAHTGYRDIFYFSRQFKAITGHPPSFYIR